MAEQYDREVERFPVELKGILLGRDQSQTYSGLARDLSQKGIRVLMRQRFVPQTPVEIRLELPDGRDPIDCRGLVVWCDESKEEENWPIACGIQFLSLPMEGRGRIISFLER